MLIISAFFFEDHDQDCRAVSLREPSQLYSSMSGTICGIHTISSGMYNPSLEVVGLMWPKELVTHSPWQDLGRLDACTWLNAVKTIVHAWHIGQNLTLVGTI